MLVLPNAQQGKFIAFFCMTGLDKVAGSALEIGKQLVSDAAAALAKAFGTA